MDTMTHHEASAPPRRQQQSASFEAQVPHLILQACAGDEAASAVALLDEVAKQARATQAALLTSTDTAAGGRLEVLATERVAEAHAQLLAARCMRMKSHGCATPEARWALVSLAIALPGRPEPAGWLLLGWARTPSHKIPTVPQVKGLLAVKMDLYAAVAAVIFAVHLFARETPARLSAEDQRNTILTLVSHHLRTPLAAIQGHAWTLWRYFDQLPAAERQDYLETIRAASEQLATTLERILQLAQLATGEVQLHLEPVAMREMAQSALMDARTKHGDRKLTFWLLPTEDDDSLVAADPLWLRRVFDEVLENAIRWTPDEGTIAIEIAPILGQNRHGGCLCRIRDNGVGMAPERVHQLFAMTGPSGLSLTPPPAGMGLGLMLSKYVITLLGGNIWAESHLSEGTTISFGLPYSPAAVSPPEQQRHD